MANILVELSKTDIKIRDVTGVDFNITYPFVDKYGEKSQSKGIGASFDGEMIDKLQFESGYEIPDVEELSSEFFIHPGMR